MWGVHGWHVYDCVGIGECHESRRVTLCIGNRLEGVDGGRDLHCLAANDGLVCDRGSRASCNINRRVGVASAPQATPVTFGGGHGIENAGGFERYRSGLHFSRFTLLICDTGFQPSVLLQANLRTVPQIRCGISFGCANQSATIADRQHFTVEICVGLNINGLCRQHIGIPNGHVAGGIQFHTGGNAADSHQATAAAAGC